MAAALKGTETTIEALPLHRYGERFEELRDASDAYLAKTGERPKIFLANLGPIAKHTGRATFAKNFFEVAGIETLSNTGFADAGRAVLPRSAAPVPRSPSSALLIRFMKPWWRRWLRR